MGALPSPDGG